MERQAKGGRLNFKDLLHMFSCFGERIVFLFQKKSHVRTHRFSLVYCLVPRPQYCAWLRVSGHVVRSCLPAVHLGHVTGSIDREGLERRRTGTRQARPHVSVFDSRSPSTEF